MMKLSTILFFAGLAISTISCQFTETLVLHEDGSGRMDIEINMNEMMAFGSGMEDSVATKIDTLISMKQLLEEKKDSIAQLPVDEQMKLKSMEAYKMRMVMNSEAGELLFTIFTDFSTIEEANKLLDGFGEASQGLPEMGGEIKVEKDESSSDILGVSYTFKNGKFRRDAFIKNPVRHAQQLDSLKGAEMFMNSMRYTLKYTFPGKIKSTSIKDAEISSDGMTLKVERNFIDYFKDPDVLDLDVALEQ